MHYLTDASFRGKAIVVHRVTGQPGPSFGQHLQTDHLRRFLACHKHILCKPLVGACLKQERHIYKLRQTVTRDPSQSTDLILLVLMPLIL